MARPEPDEPCPNGRRPEWGNPEWGNPGEREGYANACAGECLGAERGKARLREGGAAHKRGRRRGPGHRPWFR